MKDEPRSPVRIRNTPLRVGQFELEVLQRGGCLASCLSFRLLLWGSCQREGKLSVCHTPIFLFCAPASEAAFLHCSAMAQVQPEDSDDAPVPSLYCLRFFSLLKHD